MNYQTVLQNYHPTEQGDFMLRYEIGGRGYVIYSPKKDVLSCIELHGFSELTPWQLAFVLSLDMQQMKEQDELSLSVCCKREKLLSYLFDVEESETVLKTKHVSGWQGYLMMDIHKPDKVRNVFQFHPGTKESRLVFDNRLCVAFLREKEKGKLIHLCWSPSLFAAIDKGGERTAPAYLLASDAALLHGYAMKQIAECFAGTPVEERVIGIHVGDNVYEAVFCVLLRP